jgi:myo-inositol-1(or 4)-monophosphatase
MSSNTMAETTLSAFAHRLANAAGEVIKPHFRQSLTVANKAVKGLFDPVTEADKGAEIAMRALINAEFPTHGICGEEFADKPADGPYTWILDPIDGTRSFIIGMPVWGTLIGLTQDGSPILGMMDQPYTRERFWNAGGVAFFRNADGERIMHTRVCPSLGDAVLATTGPDFLKDDALHRFSALSAQVRMTRYGGDCYFYCMLAMGLIDIVAESGLKPFDIAPLVPIIRAAGGIVTTWDGGDPTNGGRILAAGDPALHAEALKVLVR